MRRATEPSVAIQTKVAGGMAMSPMFRTRPSPLRLSDTLKGQGADGKALRLYVAAGRFEQE